MALPRTRHSCSSTSALLTPPPAGEAHLGKKRRGRRGPGRRRDVGRMGGGGTSSWHSVLELEPEVRCCSGSLAAQPAA